MKLTLATAAVALAGTASAQTVASPIALLQSLVSLLSPSCQATVGAIIQPNSSIAQCFNGQGLLPILENNSSSVIPQVDAYIRGVCSTPACTNETIANTTQMVLSGCQRDLSTFGISNQTVQIIMGAYSTAREVACLSTSNSSLASNMTMMSSNMTSTNGTLCPTTILYQIQEYLGVQLTNSYIDSLLLGANATAYQSIIGAVSNTTVLQKFACQDCIIGSVDVVLENYPELANYSFALPSQASAYVPTNMTFTVPTLVQGFCNATVGPMAMLPSSINETAYNTTLPYSQMNMTTTNITANAAAARKRFARWD